MNSYNLIVKDKLFINHNVLKITLEYKESLPEMRVSSFIAISDPDGNSKFYTPIHADGKSLVLAIKVYPEGRISEYIANKSVGEEITATLFHQKREYVINEHKVVLMIAGGTGVTPMYQILNYALRNPENQTRFILLFLNKTRDDLFLIDEINSLMEGSKETGVVGTNALDVVNFITRDLSPGGGGFKLDDLEKITRDRAFDFIYVCGPPGMMESVCGKKTKDKKQGELTGMLKELGFKSEEVYKF